MYRSRTECSLSYHQIVKATLWAQYRPLLSITSTNLKLFNDEDVCESERRGKAMLVRTKHNK